MHITVKPMFKRYVKIIQKKKRSSLIITVKTVFLQIVTIFMIKI